jgi:hypothetical protein
MFGVLRWFDSAHHPDILVLLADKVAVGERSRTTAALAFLNGDDKDYPRSSS